MTLLERGPGQLDPYPPLDPVPWWSVLEPFSVLDVFLLTLLGLGVLLYVFGALFTLWRTGHEVRELLRQRRIGRRQRGSGAPGRVVPPSWFMVAIAVAYGLLLAAVWPGPRLAYWALGDRE